MKGKMKGKMNNGHLKMKTPSSSIEHHYHYHYAAVAFGLLALAVLSAAQITNYDLYYPGPQVKRWMSSYTLDISNSDGMTNYIRDVITNRGVPIAVVGVISLIGLLIWTCCRCCDRCRLKDASSICKFVLLVLLLATLLSGVFLISIGFDADKKQADAMQNLPTVAESVTSFVDEVNAYVQELLDIGDRLAQNVQDLRAEDPAGLIIDSNTLDELNNAVDTINTEAETVNDDVNQIDLGDFTTFSNKVDDYNDRRHLGFIIVLVVLLTLVLLEGAFALLNTCAGDNCKPKRNGCRYFTPIIGILSLIVLLVLWILSAALVIAMTASSDVCYDPNTQFTLLIDDPIATYYITCGHIPGQDNPFKSEVETINSSVNAAQQAFDDLQAQLNSSTQCDLDRPKCDRIAMLLNVTATIIDDLETTLGSNTIDDQGNAQDGFLSLISCYALNSRYNLVLNVFCGDAVEALGQSTEIVIGFAVVFVFTQVFTRLVTDTGLDEETSKIA
eukprot:m.155893 g.155893  ORF g.155893 m.155893 type:complete len:501 (+) comp16286_c1_seq1:198-1700(+)